MTTDQDQPAPGPAQPAPLSEQPYDPFVSHDCHTSRYCCCCYRDQHHQVHETLRLTVERLKLTEAALDATRQDLAVARAEARDMVSEMTVRMLDAERERDTAKRHLELLALEATRRVNENADTIDRLEADRDTARAEAERLRAALQTELDEEVGYIRSMCGRMKADRVDFYLNSSPSIQRMREALTVTPAAPVAQAAADAGEDEDSIPHRVPPISSYRVQAVYGGFRQGVPFIHPDDLVSNCCRDKAVCDHDTTPADDQPAGGDHGSE